MPTVCVLIRCRLLLQGSSAAGPHSTVHGGGTAQRLCAADRVPRRRLRYHLDAHEGGVCQQGHPSVCSVVLHAAVVGRQSNSYCMNCPEFPLCAQLPALPKCMFGSQTGGWQSAREVHRGRLQGGAKWRPPPTVLSSVALRPPPSGWAIQPRMRLKAGCCRAGDSTKGSHHAQNRGHCTARRAAGCCGFRCVSVHHQHTANISGQHLGLTSYSFGPCKASCFAALQGGNIGNLTPALDPA